MKLYHEGIVGHYRCQVYSSLINNVKWDCMYESIYLLLCDRMKNLIEKDYPGVIIDIPMVNGAISYVEDTPSNMLIYSMEIEFVDTETIGW